MRIPRRLIPPGAKESNFPVHIFTGGRQKDGKRGYNCTSTGDMR